MAMIPELVELFKQAQSLHARFIEVDLEVRRKLNGCADIETHVDAAYALREISEFADALRKKANATKQTAESLAIMINTANGSADTIRTEYCTASTDVKTLVSIPTRSKKPEEFGKLMDWLGVPEPLHSGGDRAVVEPNWPGLIEHINKALAEGRPLPPGVDPNKTYSESKLIIKRRKGVTE